MADFDVMRRVVGATILILRDAAKKPLLRTRNRALAKSLGTEVFLMVRRRACAVSNMRAVIHVEKVKSSQ